MSFKNWISTVVLMFSFQSAHSGGIVNSGMGVAEMQFRHAYSNLPMWISGCIQDSNSGCLANGRADQDPKVFKVLSEIKKIAIQNRSRPNRLNFVSGTIEPDKFVTGIHEHNRLASTQLQPDSDIYVNVDLLYGEGGASKFSLGEIAAILVHELGHQSGVEDHEYLDGLGGRVRFYVDRSTKVHKYEFGLARETVQMAVTEQTSPAQFAQLLLTWGDQYVVNCTPKVARFAKCSGGRRLAGFELYNDYLIPSSDQRSRQVGMIYHFQLRLRCNDPAQSRDTHEEVESRFYLYPDAKLNNYGLK